MTAEIILLEERRDSFSQTPPNPLLEALDAIGLALAEHNHVWTDREKMLYETAVGYLGVRL